MHLIDGIVDGFIMTVGITPPTPEKKRAASIFIASGLFGTVFAIMGFLGFMVHQIFAR